MKKIIVYALLIFASATFIPDKMNANENQILTTWPGDSSILKSSLVTRLDEIKKIDKSNLSRDEKREMRKERREIKKQLHDGPIVVYISLGTLLLILLILIIIF